jgi:hypothetical protein
MSALGQKRTLPPHFRSVRFAPIADVIRICRTELLDLPACEIETRARFKRVERHTPMIGYRKSGRPFTLEGELLEIDAPRSARLGASLKDHVKRPRRRLSNPRKSTVANDLGELGLTRLRTQAFAYFLVQ